MKTTDENNNSIPKQLYLKSVEVDGNPKEHRHYHTLIGYYFFDGKRWIDAYGKTVPVRIEVYYDTNPPQPPSDERERAKQIILNEFNYEPSYISYNDAMNAMLSFSAELSADKEELKILIEQYKNQLSGCEQALEDRDRKLDD